MSFYKMLCRYLISYKNFAVLTERIFSVNYRQRYVIGHRTLIKAVIMSFLVVFREPAQWVHRTFAFNYCNENYKNFVYVKLYLLDLMFYFRFLY